jgi:hypothetical protein
MTTTETTADSPPHKRRRFQYSLRTVLLLFPVVALITAYWVSFEDIPYTIFGRGGDTVISTSRFDIVLLEQEHRGRPHTGVFQVGGLKRRGGRFDIYWGSNQRPPILTMLHEYSWGRLRFDINGYRFSIDRHGRKVWANGRSHAIRHRAVITYDKQRGISVEDLKPNK